MATVHSIWWGPFKGGICVDTPKAVATACKDHQIKVWCWGEVVKQFASELGLSEHSNMQVKSCSSIKEIVGDTQYNGPNKAWYDNAQDVLVYLHSVQAYSAAKDLLSLIILHRFGGYYLDTTTVITPDTGGSQLNQSLTQAYDAPRVVQIEDSVFHEMGLQSARSIIDGNSWEVPELFQIVIRIDVWAMYSPRYDNSMQRMFMSYVSRCNRLGLYPGGQPGNYQGISGRDIIVDKEKGRNELIGNLIAHSVYDGFLGGCCVGDAEQLANYTWQAKPNKDVERDGKYTVPALGINKHHANSWR